MQYNYKTEKLIQDGVDFEYLFAEKQNLVKEMTGFEFNLATIVKFLKKETGDFKNQIPLAIDIDNQIFSIYTKWKKGQGKQKSEEDEAMPQEQPMPQEQSMPTDADNIEAIELMFDLLPDDDTQEAIELMIELLPEKEQAKMKKKLQKALKN